MIAEDNLGLASFGKPKEILEGYFSGLEVKTLTKKMFSYDAQGREISVKVYDGKGAFCYETSKAYDSFGHVVLETNPLGETTRYVYNEKHQPIEQEVLSSGKVLFLSYDLSGRITSKTEKHYSGEVFTRHFVYDAMGNLIEEEDPYGHKTFYSYDRLGRQISKTESSDGAVSLKKYNVLGQVIEETDPNGNVTLFSYNTYGDKTRIVYPDGSTERWIYYPSGWLKKHWRADGTSTGYEYNPKGKVLRKQVFDPNKQLLKEELFTYKGDLLTQAQDAMGMVTTYTYDGAGRKIAEKCGSKTISFEYDDFGRIIKTVYPLGACEVCTYDFLDRITSKTKQDAEGRIYAQQMYSYDIDGNRIEKKILQSEGSWISYRSEFGSDGKLRWQEDPLGNRITKEYDYAHINSKGQKVLACTTKDQLGRISIEVSDPYGRVEQKDILEEGALVSRFKYAYDKNGNLIERRCCVYVNGEHIRDFWVVFAYDNRGLLISETEMPEEKTTRYAYDVLGQRIRIEKPDGIVINSLYDFLGRKVAIYSEDVHCIYTYDLHDYPIESYDLINKSRQVSHYSLEGNLLQEEFFDEFGPETSVRMSYCYDENDRVTQVTLPDNSSIRYSYDAFHLTNVDRYTSDGRLAYTCACPSYDLVGHRLQDDSPAGIINYAYNKKGRKIKVDTPFWKLSLNAFDAADNLLSTTQNDPMGSIEKLFSYDRFDHLIQDDQDRYQYDNLSNCLKKNDSSCEINSQNQTISDEQSLYSYDLNGNLIAQTSPEATYTYDSLNRLKSTGKSVFSYDAFGRCLTIKDSAGKKILFYQGDQEIGSFANGEIQELRVIHPDLFQETNFAIEIGKEVYFPIQDNHYNVTALRHQDGSLAQYSRFSAFGEELLFGDTSFVNPWRFANRRQVEGLSLFSKRFYHTQLRRWLTPDPLGFEDGLNVYAYVHNNPFRYHDPDGQFAFVIPLFFIGLETAGVAIALPSIATLSTVALTTTAVYAGVSVASSLTSEFYYNDINLDFNRSFGYAMSSESSLQFQRS